MDEYLFITSLIDRYEFISSYSLNEHDVVNDLEGLERKELYSRNILGNKIAIS